MTVRNAASTPESALAVVGVGASAGGLKALQQFVEAVPADSGLAFVVIVHLDPERESRMSELLQDRAAIPVTQVNAPVKVEANHIYVIPPGQDLMMRGGGLELRDRGERSEHSPIDLFFRTLAEACGSDAVGVVLSGTGSDGTAGIRYIREAGGITVAQSPDEAAYGGMPASVIATGLIDLVLPSGQITGELIRLRQRPMTADNGAPAPEAEADLAGVLAALRNRTGHDFSMYRRATVLRRLDRRLRFNNVTTLAQYQPLLEASTTESQALLRDLLISVSSFFRDPDAYEALSAQVPSLFAGKSAADAVRVWVVGCATGEEVYSIAMLLSEHAATLADPPRLQLFATDIDEHGYAWARAGLYPAAAVAGLGGERLKKFFTPEEGGYRIAKALRELVLFAGHNVLHDPPFMRMDLISCRNLFIYLEPEAQERVLETFHFATNPAALLFLGASESAGDSGLFGPIGGSTQRLFRRGAARQRALPRLSAADPQPASVITRPPSAAPAATQPRFSYGSLHVRMLEHYAPASAIVNERLDVVHLSESVSRFLRAGAGEPTHNVLKMTSGELRKVLRTALYHAFETKSPSVRQVRTEIDGLRREVRVQVRPEVVDGSAELLALLIFEIVDSGAAPAGSASGEAPSWAESDMEEELRRTRNLLESTNEAHDRTVAELQTVNEELQSINEEQKAATEELETGREEIQSINEELTTINQEHQSTIEELKRTNEDLQNLIESTEIGTIFLDRGMRIRRFTPAVSSLFNFVPTDQGRPLSHITHHLTHGTLLEDVAAVLSSLTRLEREVESDTGGSYIMRINPYLSLDGSNEGAVLTFFDNTAQRRSREELGEAKLAAEQANFAKGMFLSTLSHEFRTPLNGILGYADLLQLEGALSPSQEQKVKRIRAGGWHLAAMIDEILTFARLDGGQGTADVELVDARTLARDAAALIQPAAEAKGLDLVLDVPDEEVPLVTDPGKARQILINLCGNAVKYTETGEVRMRVSAGADSVNFDVIDTGVGIAPEHLTRIFERFWQVDGASTRVAGGMGIGLAAARANAQLLQGDIRVVSNPGAGTTFTLWLPAEYADPSPPVSSETVAMAGVTAS